MVRILLILWLSLFIVNAQSIDQVYTKSSDKPLWGKLFEHYFNYKGYDKSYAIVIGISRYKSERYLATEEDPIRVKDYLLNEAGFDSVHLLTQDRVTKQRVGELMDNHFSRELTENDRFVFYWSGHGNTRILPRGDKRGYLPLAHTERDDYNNMISMDDIERWDDALPAKQTLYLLDSCFSGLAGESAKGSFALKQTIRQLAQPCRQLLTAGTSREQTYVDNSKESSVFTMALLSGLRGAADAEYGDFKKDGLVTVNELENYIRRSLAENRKLKGRTITPQLSELGNAEGENDGDFFFFKGKNVVQGILKVEPVYVERKEVLTAQSSQPMTQNNYNFPIPKMLNIQNKFEIGKYEVTIAEYKACVSLGECEQPKWLNKGNDYYKKMCLEDDCPIMGVSWHNAKAYVKWLSEKTGKSYRLPTEKEWEYVARAGTSSEWKWSFGNDEIELKKYAWYYENSNEKTHKVGLKLANPWGVHDMHGNVWEWTEDWYDSDKDSKVLRGGSWSNDAFYSQSAVRNFRSPTFRSYFDGFRLLRTLP